MALSRRTPPGFTFWATLCLLLAAALRLVALQDIPPGLAQDEVLDADIAAFIRDGRHALFFREGFGHEPLYHYFAAPFKPLLGDNFLAVRLPSVTLGLLLVALALRWARRAFGDLAALVAGFGLAAAWWPIIFSRVGVRPIMLPLFLLVAAWYWPRRPWLAGLWFGLSYYTYTGARVVILIPLLIIPYALFRRRRVDARRAAIALGVALLVAAPLLATLWTDPSLQQRVDQLSGPLDALRAGDPGPVIDSSLRTLGVASFTGDPRWTYGLPGRPLFDPATAVLFYAGLVVALARAGQPRYAFVLVWLAVALLPSALTPQAPSTVRLVGALPVVYVLPGLAVAWLAEQLGAGRPRRPVAVVFAALLTALLLINVGRTVRDGFARWPRATETRLNHYQSVLLAMSRHYAAEPVAGLVVADAFYEPIDHDSFQRDLGRPAPARWVQTGGDLAGAIVLPREGDGRLYVPEFAPPNPHLLARAAVPTTPLYRDDGFPSFAVYRLPVQPDIPRLATPVTFGDGLTLLGIARDTAVAGEIRYYTHWHVDGPLPADLSLFIHVLDEQGRIVAQHDGLDAAPRLLRPGDTFVQFHRASLPSENSDEAPARQLGVYTRHDGVRWNHDGPLPGPLDLDALDVDG